MKFLTIVLACLLSVGLVESLFENFLGGNEIKIELDSNQIAQDDILNEEIPSEMISNQSYMSIEKNKMMFHVQCI